MKIQQKSLGLLGLSIGIGSLLSLTPVDLVHGAEFGGDLMGPQKERIGTIRFTWNEDKEKEDSILGWDSLDSFLLTDNSGSTYDLTFVDSIKRGIRVFSYNLITGDLRAQAWQFSSDTDITKTGRIGFSITTMKDTFLAASRPVNANPAIEAALNLSETMDHKPVVIQGLSDNDDVASVPENSFVTSLLMIAGFVLIGSKKAF